MRIIYFVLVALLTSGMATVRGSEPLSRTDFAALAPLEWARAMDWQAKHGPECAARSSIPNLAGMTGAIDIVARCPLDFAHKDYEDPDDMRRVDVFEVRRAVVGEVEFYLVAQEYAAARLAAFAVLYYVGPDGTHGIAAYGPTDGEVNLTEDEDAFTRLHVLDPPGLDRYSQTTDGERETLSEILLQERSMSLIFRAPLAP